MSTCVDVERCRCRTKEVGPKLLGAQSTSLWAEAGLSLAWLGLAGIRLKHLWARVWDPGGWIWLIWALIQFWIVGPVT